MFTDREDYEGFKLQRDTLQLTAGRMCVGVGRQADERRLVVLLLARDGDSPVRRDHELNRQGTFAYGTTVRVETTSKEGVRKKSQPYPHTVAHDPLPACHLHRRQGGPRPALRSPLSRVCRKLHV